MNIRSIIEVLTKSLWTLKSGILSESSLGYKLGC